MSNSQRPHTPTENIPYTVGLKCRINRESIVFDELRGLHKLQRGSEVTIVGVSSINSTGYTAPLSAETARYRVQATVQAIRDKKEDVPINKAIKHNELATEEGGTPSVDLWQTNQIAYLRKAIRYTTHAGAKREMADTKVMIAGPPTTFSGLSTPKSIDDAVYSVFKISRRLVDVTAMNGHNDPLKHNELVLLR